MLSEEQYQSLAGGHGPTSPGMTALQWLLMQPSTGARENRRMQIMDLRTSAC